MKRAWLAVFLGTGLVTAIVLAADTRIVPGAVPAGAEGAILADGVDLATAGSSADRSLLSAVRSALERAPGAAELAVDYPLEGSFFPPDMVAPRFLWHDSSKAERWVVDLRFLDGSGRVTLLSVGASPPQGEIDPACIGSTNEVYQPTPHQASARSWQASDEMWQTLRAVSADRAVIVTILGVASDQGARILSRGSVRLTMSRDPVGAPLFYRDVPLMPSKTEKNVIKPLAERALPLIRWRLRDLSRRESRVVLKDMPTCANCHSFSSDGRKLGMDMDGPDGDKGAYALAPIRPQMQITQDQVFTWNSFKEKPKDHRTIGFLSQVSPDGEHVVTTVNEELYVSNFTNYRFIQVFYPTRGILAYYSAKTEEMKGLPGADDPEYVHCDPAWSPDGQTIVFARAKGRDSYAPGVPLAAEPNDPNETPMKYDLYRIPFAGGRGGKAVPLEGASQNGMSNGFPKVSPDGRFVVFVKARNGQLLRPDSELWIVPLGGGEARRMRCNTPLMNSWHSFSPNGRWMVFSSKANTPYTQLFLTHLDLNGESTPAILVPDSTAANRAANIPEFVNISYDGLVGISAPSVDVYRYLNRATALLGENQPAEAIAPLEKALGLEPESVKTHLLLGTAFWRTGRVDEAMAYYEKAAVIEPGRVETNYTLSFALFLQERNEEGIARFKRAFADPAALGTPAPRVRRRVGYGDAGARSRCCCHVPYPARGVPW